MEHQALGRVKVTDSGNWVTLCHLPTLASYRIAAEERYEDDSTARFRSYIAEVPDTIKLEPQQRIRFGHRQRARKWADALDQLGYEHIGFFRGQWSDTTVEPRLRALYHPEARTYAVILEEAEVGGNAPNMQEMLRGSNIVQSLPQLRDELDKMPPQLRDMLSANYRAIADERGLDPNALEDLGGAGTETTDDVIMQYEQMMSSLVEDGGEMSLYFFRFFEDGGRVTCTNAHDALEVCDPDNPRMHEIDATAPELHDRLLASRNGDPVLPATPEGFAEAFERTYAAEVGYATNRANRPDFHVETGLDRYGRLTEDELVDAFFEVDDAPFALRKHLRRHGRFAVEVEPPKRALFGLKSREPTDAQIKAYADLQEHEAAITAALIDAVYHHYSKLTLDAASDELAIEADRPDHLKDLISLSKLVITRQAKAGVAQVVYRFRCAWDDDDVLVTLHGEKVIEVAVG